MTEHIDLVLEELHDIEKKETPLPSKLQKIVDYLCENLK